MQTDLELLTQQLVALQTQSEDKLAQKQSEIAEFKDLTENLLSQIEDLRLSVRVLQGTIQFPVAPTSRLNSGLQSQRHSLNQKDAIGLRPGSITASLQSESKLEKLFQDLKQEYTAVMDQL